MSKNGEKLNIQPIAKMLSYAVYRVEPKHMELDQLKLFPKHKSSQPIN